MSKFWNDMRWRHSSLQLVAISGNARTIGCQIRPSAIGTLVWRIRASVWMMCSSENLLRKESNALLSWIFPATDWRVFCHPKWHF